MTNKEARRILLDIADQMPSDVCADWIDAIGLGIQALDVYEKTRTGEDCISRQAAIDFIIDNYGLKCSSLTNGIRDYLPSITPQRLKGRWIANHDESKDMYTINCSCCGYRLVGVLNSEFTKEQALDCAKDEIKNAPFCCKCGAEMNGGEEDAVSD